MQKVEWPSSKVILYWHHHHGMVVLVLANLCKVLNWLIATACTSCLHFLLRCNVFFLHAYYRPSNNELSIFAKSFHHSTMSNWAYYEIQYRIGLLASKSISSSLAIGSITKCWLHESGGCRIKNTSFHDIIGQRCLWIDGIAAATRYFTKENSRKKKSKAEARNRSRGPRVNALSVTCFENLLRLWDGFTAAYEIPLSLWHSRHKENSCCLNNLMKNRKIQLPGSSSRNQLEPSLNFKHNFPNT